jgi:hypothetical protein
MDLRPGVSRMWLAVAGEPNKDEEGVMVMMVMMMMMMVVISTPFRTVTRLKIATMISLAKHSSLQANSILLHGQTDETYEVVLRSSVGSPRANLASLLAIPAIVVAVAVVIMIG